MGFLKPFLELINFQSAEALTQTQLVFRALADAVIPGASSLPGQALQYLGGLDSHVDESLIWTLNHNVALMVTNKEIKIRLANATAEMLNVAARQLVWLGENKKPVDRELFDSQQSFAALELGDRFRAIKLLEALKVDTEMLPVPFRNSSDFVLAIVSVLILLITIGYYSEWSGHGSTRLEPPDRRVMEHFPVGWKQVGYPGLSKGYRAFRGYLTE